MWTGGGALRAAMGRLGAQEAALPRRQRSWTKAARWAGGDDGGELRLAGAKLRAQAAALPGIQRSRVSAARWAGSCCIAAGGGLDTDESELWATAFDRRRCSRADAASRPDRCAALTAEAPAPPCATSSLPAQAYCHWRRHAEQAWGCQCSPRAPAVKTCAWQARTPDTPPSPTLGRIGSSTRSCAWSPAGSQRIVTHGHKDTVAYQSVENLADTMET